MRKELENYLEMRKQLKLVHDTDIHGIQIRQGKAMLTTTDIQALLDREAQATALVEHAADLIAGDLVGSEWKKACSKFLLMAAGHHAQGVENG